MTELDEERQTNLSAGMKAAMLANGWWTAPNGTVHTWATAVENTGKQDAIGLSIWMWHWQPKEHGDDCLENAEEWPVLMYSEDGLTGWGADFEDDELEAALAAAGFNFADLRPLHTG